MKFWFAYPKKAPIGASIAISLLGGVIAYALTYLLTPQYTSTIKIVQPQQNSATSGLLSALSGLSTLASLGSGAGIKNPGEQWIGYLKSRTIANRIIEEFALMRRYQVDTMTEARDKLASRTEFDIGRDGLIEIQHRDEDPKFAAQVATKYVTELRKLTTDLSLQSSAQKREFFEGQLAEIKVKLKASQESLTKSGINGSTINTNPSAALEASLRVQQQIAELEMQLTIASQTSTAENFEIKKIKSALETAKATLRNLESDSSNTRSDAYIDRYRTFKYNEELFEIVAKQYELARAEETQSGLLVQVIDSALVPEFKSSPRRGRISALTALAIFLGITIIRAIMARRTAQTPT